MIDVRSIWDNQHPTGDLVVKTKIENIQHFNCYAATNHITGNLMFILKVSTPFDSFNYKKLKFKGVKIEMFEYSDCRELVIYLLDNELKEIFSYFIEDILKEIKDTTTEIDALNRTSNIILKWKSLFDKVVFSGLTIEQQKGLLGELLFVNKMIDINYPIDKVLESWTGVEYDNKDFIIGTTGLEAKFTSSKNPSVKISSERQLDGQNLSSLFLVLYISEEVKENGYSLNSIIQLTREKINTNHSLLLKFNEMLFLVGYKEDDIDNYHNRYALKKTCYYQIADNFPKLVSSDLKLGVYNSSYYIEISACEEYLIDEEKLLKIFLNGK